MAKKLGLSEASKVGFESSSDDDASSDSSCSLDSKDYSETNDTESKDTFPELQQSGSSDDDDAAGSQVRQVEMYL